LLILIYHTAAGQNDSLIFKNGNFIVGEIKSLDKGVVQVSTDFSDSDFKIEWDGIQSINTETYFFILTSLKTRHYGQLKSISDSSVIIVNYGLNVELNIENIVMLIPVKKSFKDRFAASIDFGFSLTKANNLKQLTSRSSLGYKAQKWSTEAVFNYLGSMSDNADTVHRAEGGIVANYLISEKWFVSITESMLSASEQNLKYRINSKLGMGRYLLHTNKSYWTTRLGANRNLEKYTGVEENRKSWEFFLGTELNMFDIGDLNLMTRLNAYKSITEKGRWRLGGIFDVKYDLPLDLYIKAGISVDFDNQPADDAGEFDYVLQTGIGWEW
jgi:hypothetical protein